MVVLVTAIYVLVWLFLGQLPWILATSARMTGEELEPRPFVMTILVIPTTPSVDP
jgi:hypothetical protein